MLPLTFVKPARRWGEPHGPYISKVFSYHPSASVFLIPQPRDPAELCPWEMQLRVARTIGPSGQTTGCSGVRHPNMSPHSEAHKFHMGLHPRDAQPGRWAAFKPWELSPCAQAACSVPAAGSEHATGRCWDVLRYPTSIW
jgi:hypothetical protein